MCDTFCVPDTNGMFFAKNSDRPTSEVQLVKPLAPEPVHPPSSTTTTVTTQYLTIDTPQNLGCVAAVASQPTWLWGAEHVVNAAGVAIGNEKVWTTDDPRAASPALIGMDLVRLAAQRTTSADQAVDVITSLVEQWGQGGSGEQHADEPYWSSFLVVDPRGGWVVETSGCTWVAEPVQGPKAISNRLTVGTGWTRSSSDVAPGTNWQGRLDPAVPTGIADHRLAATITACGNIDAGLGDRDPTRVAGQLVAALRDHGTGPWGAPGSPAAMGSAPAPPPPEGVADDWSGVTVCMHIRDYQCTTASMAAWLPENPDATIVMWASVGPACCAMVLPAAIVRHGGEVATVVPAALGNPAVWFAASTAARHAETAQTPRQAADVITGVRRAVGVVEAQAWDEAEALVACDAGVVAWREAARRWSDAALAAVGDPPW